MCKIGPKIGFRFRVDDRADIRLWIGRVADYQAIHGARQRLNRAVRGVMRQEKDAQAGAPLTGRIERRHANVVDDLLFQRRRIDKHAVEAARLRDERNDRAVFGGERAIDQTRDFG